MRLVLASGSPRRRELLELAGLEPEVRPSPVDEAMEPGELPTEYVARLAVAKALAGARAADEVVVAADTAVILDGDALGKPRDDAEARAMLQRLAGRAHTVATGVAVQDPAGTTMEQTVTTEVVMAPLDEATVAAYVTTGEPMDKAGGYAIQGRAAAFVQRLDGSWTNVVGLPLAETLAMLRSVGIRPPAHAPTHGGSGVPDPSAGPG